MSIVVLIDQQLPRRSEDLVPALQQQLSERLNGGLARPFERMLGDKLVGVLSGPQQLPALMVALDESAGAWTLSAGYGELDELGASANTARGEAARNAEAAAARVSKSLAGVAVDGGESAPALEGAANLLANIMAERSERQREVVALRRQNLTGQDMADRLGISRRAVTKHLTAAKYGFEAEAVALVAFLSEQASRDAKS